MIVIFFAFLIVGLIIFFISMIVQFVLAWKTRPEDYKRLKKGLWIAVIISAVFMTIGYVEVEQIGIEQSVKNRPITQRKKQLAPSPPPSPPPLVYFTRSS